MKEAFSTRLKYYLLWMLPVSAVFFGLYPTINLFTATRSDTLALWLPAELSIPFIPALIWAYLSMYLIVIAPLFFLTLQGQKRLAVELMVLTVIAALLFLMFPARLGFVRQLPDVPLYHALYAQLLSLDRPHNLVPSLHVAWSCTAVLAITRRAGRGISAVFYLWFIAISASTLFVHQHHLLDVAAGFLLSLLVSFFTGRVYEKDSSSTVSVLQP